MGIKERVTRLEGATRGRGSRCGCDQPPTSFTLLEHAQAPDHTACPICGKLPYWFTLCLSDCEVDE